MTSGALKKKKEKESPFQYFEFPSGLCGAASTTNSANLYGPSTSRIFSLPLAEGVISWNISYGISDLLFLPSPSL